MQIFFSSNLLGRRGQCGGLRIQLNTFVVTLEASTNGSWEASAMNFKVCGRLKGIGHLAKKEHTSEQCLKIQQCCFVGNDWFTGSLVLG